MKKLIAFMLVLLMVISMMGCGRISLDSDATGTVTYRFGDVSFEESLTPAEVKAVVEILNGKEQYNDFLGTPSCGFSTDISITIDGVCFAIARDKCGTVKNCANGNYIDISDEERQTLETIFTSHGGRFPCI